MIFVQNRTILLDFFLIWATWKSVAEIHIIYQILYPQAIKDIIDEEEAQFLKTLTRGRRLLNGTIAKMSDGSKVLPGDIAWRLYDTYGFPIDLTQLMAEERDMTVDFEAYEKAKAAAILASQGKV